MLLWSSGHHTILSMNEWARLGLLEHWRTSPQPPRTAVNSLFSPDIFICSSRVVFWLRTRAAPNHIGGMPDPYYGAIDLLKTGVPHPGAITTHIRRLLLFQKHFVQFFHRIWWNWDWFSPSRWRFIDLRQVDYTEKHVANGLWQSPLMEDKNGCASFIKCGVGALSR